MKNKYFYLAILMVLSIAAMVVGYFIVGVELKDIILLAIFTVLVILISGFAGLLLKGERKKRESKKVQSQQTPEEAIAEMQAALDKATVAQATFANTEVANLDIASEDDNELVHEIDEALINNEFTLYYQPKVTLKNGKIIGLEALIRWNSPKRGFISPGQFLPVANSSGKIVDIGKWVIETATKTIKDWIIRGFNPLPVAVNLSTREIESPDILNFIIYCCDKYCVERTLLEFEIAQLDYLSNTALYSKLINSFKTEGFLISLDDFTTELEGANMLKEIPCDGIKLDKSFLKDLTSNQNISAARDTISLANALDINVVCECVETQEQVDHLMEVGCTVAQGYYFSRPMSGNNVTELLRV